MNTFFLTDQKPVGRRGKIICPIGDQQTMVAWLGLATSCGDGEQYREILLNDALLKWRFFDNYEAMQEWLQAHPQPYTLSAVMPAILAAANPKYEE